MSTMDYEPEPRTYEDEDRGYDRDRSRSPREERNGDAEMRARSASPNGRDTATDRPAAAEERNQDDGGSVNPGSNLFVTGIHPRLTEEAVTRLFEKYGSVEKCQIMRDPHSGDSRGFGFVKMVTPEEADAAKDGLQGVVHEGRTLSIEKARRARPRTPTPGKYYGPPKRDDFRQGSGRRGGGGGRYGGRDGYDDRRGGGGRRDDNYGGYRSRYDDRYDDRSGGYGRRDREDYGGRGVDRYASGRDDRYGRGGDDRRGYYDRPSRSYGGGGAGGAGGGYGDAAPPADDREGYTGGSRSYEDRGDSRYERW